MGDEENDPIVGLELTVVRDLQEAITNVQELGYAFVLTHIVHPRLKGKLFAGKSCGLHPKFLARPEDSLTANDWTTFVATKISDWIDVDTVGSERTGSEKALENEIEYSYYLGVEVVVVPLRSKNCMNLARHLRKRTPPVSHRAVQYAWVKVPMTDPNDACKVFLNDVSQDSVQLDSTECTWEWWNTLRTVTNGHKVYLALEITSCCTKIEMDRWCCEPIHVLMIDTSVFQTDESGFPILPVTLKVFIRNVVKFNGGVRFVITGSNLHGDFKLYKECLVHLYKTSKCSEVSRLSKLLRSGKDFVQVPILPLMDTMNPHTAELFEKDVVKYGKYGRAIRQALMDTVPDEEKDKIINVLIVGGGRGSLISVVLSSAQETDRIINVVVYEKNINARLTLHVLCQKLGWTDRVVIASSDIENLDSMEKFDIIVSEFLGVAVANELLPESMNKAKRFLKENGIMIPSSCTKYLAPMCSRRLYDATYQLISDVSLKALEMPYMVLLPNLISMAHALPLFTFHFPCKEPINNKFAAVKFIAQCDYVSYGFLCFLEIVLYKDFKLSIHPDDKVENFYSLVPLYFPVHNPIYVKEGEIVEACFWRCGNNSEDVWYEWGFAKPLSTIIHNQDGRSHKMAIENSVF